MSIFELLAKDVTKHPTKSASSIRHFEILPKEVIRSVLLELLSHTLVKGTPIRATRLWEVVLTKKDNISPSLSEQYVTSLRHLMTTENLFFWRVVASAHTKGMIEVTTRRSKVFVTIRGVFHQLKSPSVSVSTSADVVFGSLGPSPQPTVDSTPLGTSSSPSSPPRAVSPFALDDDPPSPLGDGSLPTQTSFLAPLLADVHTLYPRMPNFLGSVESRFSTAGEFDKVAEEFHAKSVSDNKRVAQLLQDIANKKEILYFAQSKTARLERQWQKANDDRLLALAQSCYDRKIKKKTRQKHSQRDREPAKRKRTDEP
jgi:hypothetical protein